jgi:outer membrane protein assembly factor BamB
VDDVQSAEPDARPLAADLDAARRFLSQVTWQDRGVAPELSETRIEGDPDAPLSFSTVISLRARTEASQPSDVERNDLHSLLFVGPFRVRLGDVCRDLGDVHAFLLAEALVAEAANVLEAWESGRALHRRAQVAGVVFSTRLTSEGKLSLTLGGQRTGGLQAAPTFPAVSVPSFAEAVVAFGRALARPILRLDRSQQHNLRMRLFKESVRDLALALREAVRADAKVNDSPESYRAFADSLPSKTRSGAQRWGQTRIRFQSTWQATVPGIDLNSTFLFGDRLVVAGTRELASIDRAAGRLLWRTSIERGVSIAAPNGVVRLSADGVLSFHDLETGEATMNVRLAARQGGTPAGAVVNAPGLPRVVVLSEGDRHITAVDYVSGEVRWRHALARGRTFKVRRAGRLLVVSSSDNTLTALDVASGETVWRVRDRLKFCRPIAYDRNDLFVVTGAASPILRCAEVLHSLDPWTGMSRWQRELPSGRRTLGAPLASADAVVVATHDQRGTGFAAFDRTDGTPRWVVEPGFAPTTSAWLMVDDLLVVNGDNGVAAALDLRDGTPRWRSPVDVGPEGDVPRHLDPILRSGALFVPQRTVSVLRPNDGERLGEIPSELVPDLVRVDESCNVVVVEESGHLASFAAGPRLTLIKS